ncbi:MAG: HAD hydrolase-like protein [Solirubrobacterales bacterium]|nr:HAD hydrolase-like protein [Solirubrobacterales bacterium]
MPAIVLLDVNGTLTDLTPIGAPWEDPGLGERVLNTAIFTGMVDALSGTGQRSFSEHLSAAVEVRVADEDLDPSGVAAAIQAAAALPARPGAADALARLRAGGVTLIALTNSGAAAGRATLEGCGLIGFVERVLGVDAVATFKPHPDVYAYALAQAGRDPAQVTLLATHAWDLAGAKYAGMGTAWVRHGAVGWPAVFPEPDVSGETLVDVAQALLAA